MPTVLHRTVYQTKSWISRSKPNERLRRRSHQLAIILLFTSILLQFLYGVGTLAETIIWKWIGAEVYRTDSEEIVKMKLDRVTATKTTFAVIGFIIAILTIIVGTFTDDLWRNKMNSKCKVPYRFEMFYFQMFSRLIELYADKPKSSLVVLLSTVFVCLNSLTSTEFFLTFSLCLDWTV